MTTDHEHDAELARELHTLRATPRAEYARELDARAASWLRPRRGLRLPPLRVAAPALAAACAVVAVVVVFGGGGDEQEPSPAGARLELTASPAASADTPSAAPNLESSGAGAGSAIYGLEARQVGEDEPLVVRYQLVGPARAQVRLGNRRGRLELEGGDGTLMISTEGIAPGTYELEFTIGHTRATVERVRIG